MIDNNLNQRRTYIGGGYRGTSVLDALFSKLGSIFSSPPMGVTWPFARLTFTEQYLEFEYPHLKYVVKYTDVEKVSLNLSGYIIIWTKDGLENFGFTSPNINNILSNFSKNNIESDRITKQRILIAQIVVMLQIFIPILVALTVIWLTLIN